jgi:head-tail adaptor
MVLSGELRNYLVVQSGTRTSDGQGGWTLVWGTVYSEWFKVTPLSMSRTLDEQGVKYRSAIELICRYRSDLTSANRITWNFENYTINSVVPTEKLDYLKILAYV